MKLRLLLHICLIFISVTVFGQSLAPFVPTGIMDNDAYGFSVSIDEQGELAVVGSPMDSEISASAGAAYVLVKQGNNWSEQIKLTAPDAAANDWFGHGVTMSSSGNFIAVSALLDDDNGSESGSVYIFVKDGGTWTFQAKITPTDGSTMDWFGQSLSLNQQGDVLAVSSHLDDDNGNDSGSAYIFERIGDTWSERDKITPTDGDAEDYFAYALSLDASGNRLAISAYRDEPSGLADAGSVYIFDYSGSWSESQKINASDASTNSWFGHSLDLNDSGEDLVIGADATNGFEGAAYIFNYSGTWSEIQKITPNSPNSGDAFGVSCAMNNSANRILIGAYGDDENGTNAGASYSFVWDGNNWIQENKWTPTDATINDNFGNALAISNNDIGIIGANGKNNSGGASYSLDFSNNLFVTGKLIADLNDNCIEDGSDIPARNWLIKFSNGTDEYYTITDADGNWELYLNKNGNYTGEIIFPNPYWNICTPDISFNHTGGINEINIPTTLLEREISCSYLNIGITTNELVRCYSNQYLITYSNNGTTPETGVYIELNFDADLNVLGSSIPWTSQIGNNYRFDIDDLNVFESGSFTIEVEVDCSTELGRTHCSTASIYPQGFCFPSWNGDVISLEAECTGSDVEFRIGNIGLGNMLVPRSYIVTEDMVMRINEDYQLNSGLEELIIYPSNGATIRLETTQDIAYPFADSVLSLTYEGCGMNASGNISTSFVNMYSDNDESPFKSISCRENIGSYDPNDKQAFPVGYDTPHYIEANRNIEYLIRFQNTGTDMAHLVVIRDTLSEFLNPASLIIEGASHDYDFNILGNGIVEFVFENINLPDSTTNEIASQGYIKYKINQLMDNPLGTVIYNNAGIYFDFNEPIITNKTYHTIGRDFIAVNLISVWSPEEYSHIKVSLFPNPSNEFIHLDIKGIESNDFRFELFDINGKLIKKEKFNSAQLKTELNGLLKGVYPYLIYSENELINTGKIIIQ